MILFWRPYVSIADRFAEFLCGLVMLLTFTLAARFWGASPREIVVGATGCALAWGVIDGVTLILNSMFQRGWRDRLVMDMRQKDRTEALKLMSEAFDVTLEPVSSESERVEIYDAFLRAAKNWKISNGRVTKGDLLGGIGLVIIEGLCSLFVIIPALVIPDFEIALRVSNGLLVSMLFYLGYHRAAHARWDLGPRIVSGLVTMSVGVVLVLLAIVLGG
jgi:hypothetical protein